MIRCFIVFAIAASAIQVPPGSSEKIGAWVVETDRDAMTDVASISVHVRSASARLDYGCGGKGGSPAMFILTTTGFLGEGANKFRRVMFRVDGGAPLVVTWRYSDTSAVAQYPDVVRPVRDLLANGKKLVVRAVTYRGEYIDTEFDIDEAREAFTHVEAECSRQR